MTDAAIVELESLLNKETGWDDDRAIKILPNGEIRAVGARAKDLMPLKLKPLTMRENLGGEYGMKR